MYHTYLRSSCTPKAVTLVEFFYIYTLVSTLVYFISLLGTKQQDSRLMLKNCAVVLATHVMYVSCTFDLNWKYSKAIFFSLQLDFPFWRIQTHHDFINLYKALSICGLWVLLSCHFIFIIPSFILPFSVNYPKWHTVLPILIYQLWTFFSKFRPSPELI